MPETDALYNERYLNDPGQINFDDDLVTRYSQEGETSFSREYPCIIKRVSLATVSGQPLINLSDDVLSIRRITWRGFKLDPLPHRNFREVFQNATQIGRPFWYVFNSLGANVIQLFPAPNESIGINNGCLYSSDVINTSFIVEYFCTPAFSLSSFIPAYVRRRLLKVYVMRSCFNKEGQGQNAKASKYFKDKWNGLNEKYGQLLDDLHNKPRKLVVNGISASYYFPGQPILPIGKFGTSCDAGE